MLIWILRVASFIGLDYWNDGWNRRRASTRRLGGMSLVSLPPFPALRAHLASSPPRCCKAKSSQNGATKSSCRATSRPCKTSESSLARAITCKTHFPPHLHASALLASPISPYLYPSIYPSFCLSIYLSHSLRTTGATLCML